jgi:phage baseplate assembly protein W
MAEHSDFIGRGIAFPLRVDGRGGIALISGPEELDASLRTVLSTAPGERVMRPEFGCAIWDHMFAPINENTLGLMAQAVRDAAAQWEPRVELEDVRVLPEPGGGRVTIEVDYRVRATNDRRNLVFPFYVLPEEGE